MIRALVLAGLCWTAVLGACPDQEAGLTLFSSLGVISDRTLDVAITKSVLIDVPLIEVNTITVSGSGRLIFKRGLTITIYTKGILVKDNAALIIGSSDCRHEDDVNIFLEGERSANRKQLSDAGEKYIAVQDDGVLQIFGKEKLGWTKLSATVDRYSADATNVYYSHMEERMSWWRWNEGLGLYRFCCSDDIEAAEYVSYQLFDTVQRTTAKEQQKVDLMATTLDDITDGEIVGITLQYFFKGKDDVDFDTLFDKIEDVAGIPRDELLLRKAKKWDAFALIFVKGEGYNQVLDVQTTSTLTRAMASMVFGGRKLTALSRVYEGRKDKGNVDFRILNLDAGTPVINVLDNVRDTWNVGDEVLLTTTDYAVHHGEIRRIKEFVSDKSFRLDGELEYRHFGEVEEGVDMRGEVALLSRNIRIEGVMGPCGANENCNMGYSTYGGHMKAVFSFGSINIDGVALRYMGQAFDKGNYPIHFHMCKNITGKTALVRRNSIRDSYARAITVHGTFGSSETDLGVQLIDNVAHNIFGHAYFLEDGAEMATSFIGNLVSRVKNINNGFETDKRRATGFWITNPKTIMVNNVAAGCDGHGIWYTFPLEPVGPSKGLVYAHKEAKHTALWTFDNNVGHSNSWSGMNFDNILVNDDGKVVGCMNYEPVSDPLDKSSTPVKVQLSRFTGYKNLRWNMWIRGGLFEVIQMSSAESRIGIQIARASKQPQFVRKSVFLGQSTNNGEEEGYPDALTPEALGRYNGYVVYDGPVYISETYFNKFSFEVNDTFYSTAIGFNPKNKFFSSVVTSFEDIRFGYKDDGSSSKRVFDGHILNNEVLGFGDFDGDESATLRDVDGSVSRCTGDSRFSQLVKPERFSLSDNCVLRENWQMAICDDKYGKIRVSQQLFTAETAADTFDTYGVMRRRRYSDSSDLAYEDHAGTHRSSFITVLGNTEFYYEYQYRSDVFPRRVFLFGLGVERNYPVVVGLCLPVGITKDDLSIRWSYPDSSTYVTDGVRWVDNVKDVATEGSNPRMFLDGRILYMMLTSRRTRDNNWDAYDYQDCPGKFCPFGDITVARNLPNTPCFDVPAGEIDAEYFTDGLARQTCDLPASAPNADWGAGDTSVTSQDGNWGEWGQWSYCCNAPQDEPSTSYRYRMCDNPSKRGDGADCQGDGVQDKPCEVGCPANGAWSPWSSFSDCICDKVGEETSGVMMRTRECMGVHNLGTFCNGADRDYRTCNGDCSTDS